MLMRLQGIPIREAAGLLNDLWTKMAKLANGSRPFSGM